MVGPQGLASKCKKYRIQSIWVCDKQADWISTYVRIMLSSLTQFFLDVLCITVSLWDSEKWILPNVGMSFNILQNFFYCSTKNWSVFIVIPPLYTVLYIFLQHCKFLQPLFSALTFSTSDKKKKIWIPLCAGGGASALSAHGLLEPLCEGGKPAANNRPTDYWECKLLFHPWERYCVHVYVRKLSSDECSHTVIWWLTSLSNFCSQHAGTSDHTRAPAQ